MAGLECSMAGLEWPLASLECSMAGLEWPLAGLERLMAGLDWPGSCKKAKRRIPDMGGFSLTLGPFFYIISL